MKKKLTEIKSWRDFTPLHWVVTAILVTVALSILASFAKAIFPFVIGALLVWVLVDFFIFKNIYKK